MKITFHRQMLRNYLVITESMPKTLYYECHMLSYHRMEGLLPFSYEKKEEEILYYYEITSKQPLSCFLERKRLQAEEIRSLILSICQTIQKMEQYLLSEQSLYLNPEYLYIDLDQLEIKLCFVPGMIRDFANDFASLTEYLLDKVDREDRDSVILAYTLFQVTRHENFGMDDIMKAIFQKEEHHSSKIEVDRMKQETISEQMTEEREEKKKKKQIKQWLESKWKQNNTDTGVSMENQMETKVWDTLFMEAPPQEDNIKLASRDTVLLHKETDVNETRRLISLTEGQENIDVLYVPFIIGKQENLVDYLLADEAVSRIHMRIDQAGDVYYITDLNSTNGTTVDNIPLLNNQRTELKLGDEISISHFRFRFL